MMIEQISLCSTTSLVQALSTGASPMVWSESLTAYMLISLCGPEVQPRAAFPWCLSDVLGLFPSAQTAPHNRVFFLPPMLGCRRIQNNIDVGGTGFRLLPWFLLQHCSSVLDVHIYYLFAIVSESLLFILPYQTVYSFRIRTVCKRKSSV